MKLLPAGNFEIETGMAREEAVLRLREVTGGNEYIASPPDKNTLEGLVITEEKDDETAIERQLFAGNITQEGFQIWRREDFYVYGEFSNIYGEFKDGENGTTISVKLKVGFVRKAFFWLGVAALTLCIVLFIDKDRQITVPGFLNFVVAVFCLGCSITLFRWFGVFIFTVIFVFASVLKPPIVFFMVVIFAVLLYFTELGMRMRLRAEARMTKALFALVFKERESTDTSSTDNNLSKE